MQTMNLSENSPILIPIVEKGDDYDTVKSVKAVNFAGFFCNKYNEGFTGI